MIASVYTEKQRALLQLLKNGGLKRINLLQGSVRSGKTWISLVLWAFWVASMPKGENYLMAAKSLNTLKRNCLDLLSDLVGQKNFTYSISKKEGWLFGRRILLEGVHDTRAEGKIRGLTLTGAYCDELSLFDEEFFKMLLTRLSKKNAKLFATTNPDSPSHWLMEGYIKRKEEIDMLLYNFYLEDNTFLGKEYIEALKKEFSGVFYDRFILGKWVAAQGVIYREFIEHKEEFITDEIPPAAFSQIGVDFGGNKSAHAFILTGIAKDYSKIAVLDEWYFKGEITPSALFDSFISFYEKNKCSNIVSAYCDSAEPVLINGLRTACLKKGIPIHIFKAKKGPVLGRIRFYSLLMNKRALTISSKCKIIIKALEEALWDDNAKEDRRLDNFTSNIDSLDALEYATENIQENMTKYLL